MGFYAWLPFYLYDTNTHTLFECSLPFYLYDTHILYVWSIVLSSHTHTHTHTQNFVSKKEKPLNGEKKRILTSCCDDVKNMWHAHMGVATSTCFLQCHTMLQECYISPPRTGCLKMRCRSS